ncbi:hypothetical protein PVAG01_07049 [Phlyctema vagabunda]|uniref:Uncharacterized protein n=1 Tax=Phlyctema vagabunda TaxID=108571 RepID=A0ABR4PBB7_9HELO
MALGSGKWPPVTRGRVIPPEPRMLNPLDSLSHPPTVISRLFEASTLLDNVYTALNQPTSQISFNIDEATMLVKTLQSFEVVMEQEMRGSPKLFCSSIALSTTALLFTAENGSKPAAACVSKEAAMQANAFLDFLIDDIVERVAVLAGNNALATESGIPPFLALLLYKAAAITTARLHNDVEPDVNLRRLKILRNGLARLASRWLAAGRFLDLMDEDTTPRVLRALKVMSGTSSDS